MAIARAAHIVGAISGNLGATVFVNKGHALQIHHRPLKTNRRTSLQVAKRSWHAYCINAWRALTPAQVLQWRTAAAGIATSNRLGTRSQLSAFQLFMIQNLPNQGDSVSFASVPREYQSAYPCLPTDITFTAGGTYSITLTRTDTYNVGWTIVSGYRPFRTTETRGVRSWTKLGHIFFNDATPKDIAYKWDPKLGPPAAGEFVMVKLALRGTGWFPNPPYIASTTVLAP